MSSNNDPFYLDCFAYGSEVSLSDLAAVCDAEIASDGQFDALPKQPRFSVAQAPFRTWPAGTECPPRYEHEDIFLLYTFAGT